MIPRFNVSHSNLVAKSVFSSCPKSGIVESCQLAGITSVLSDSCVYKLQLSLLMLRSPLRSGVILFPVNACSANEGKTISSVRNSLRSFSSISCLRVHTYENSPLGRLRSYLRFERVSTLATFGNPEVGIPLVISHEK